MSSYKWVIAVAVVILGLAVFPGMKSSLASNTTGFGTLTLAAFKAVPYLMVGMIIWVAYQAAKGHGGNQ